MTTRRSLFAAAAVASALLTAVPVKSQVNNRQSLFAKLAGSNEVPAISTTGKGQFHAKIDDVAGSIEYTLSYHSLVGTTVVQAHVHFAEPSVNGGVSFFLCGGGPQAIPCPAAPGVVHGTITSADVIGPTGQGIAAGEFAKIVAAMRSGLAYANVHTNTFGGGEIRGQIQ